jgi:signal-transduction protein with cAMP-binding, CBS, and nucleotidyltransferase domain
MKNIIAKIKQVHPLSDEALNALISEMEVKYYPKNTCIVHSGTTDRMVYFIEEGITRSVFHHDGKDPPPGSARKVMLPSGWIRCTTTGHR